MAGKILPKIRRIFEGLSTTAKRCVPHIDGQVPERPLGMSKSGGYERRKQRKRLGIIGAGVASLDTVYQQQPQLFQLVQCRYDKAFKINYKSNTLCRTNRMPY